MNFKYFFAIFLLMIVSLNKIEATKPDNYVIDAIKIICPLLKKFNFLPKHAKKMNCKEIINDIKKMLNDCGTNDDPLCNIIISLPTTAQVFTFLGCLATGPISTGVCLASIGLGALTPFFS